MENLPLMDSIALSCTVYDEDMGGMRYLLLSSQDLGAKIGEKRKARGLSQRELSELSGVSRSIIATLEAGTSNLNLLETLIAILDVLDEEIITVPRDSLPIIEHVLWSLKPERLISERNRTGPRQKFVRKARKQNRSGTGCSDTSGAIGGEDPSRGQGGVGDTGIVRVQKDSHTELTGFAPPDPPQNFDVPK